MDSETSCYDKQRLHEQGNDLPKSFKVALHDFSVEPCTQETVSWLWCGSKKAFCLRISSDPLSTLMSSQNWLESSHKDLLTLGKSYVGFSHMSGTSPYTVLCGSHYNTLRCIQLALLSPLFKYKETETQVKNLPKVIRFL